MSGAERVAFHFDPICPWAYQASVWIRDVRDAVGIEIDWRFFSLEEVNREEGKKHPWEREWSYGWSQMRIAALLRRRDPSLVERWYAAQGAAFFERGEPVFLREGAEKVLLEIGLDGDVIEEALSDDSTHDDVRDDHDSLVQREGGFGVPTLVFEGGRAVFGPVIQPAPRGADALRLWDVVTAWRRFPTLYEMRTPKREQDWAEIGEAFRPYLETRRWQTVQKPVD